MVLQSGLSPKGITYCADIYIYIQIRIQPKVIYRARNKKALLIPD